MRAFGGDVAVPDEPALSLAAGMALAAHPDAVHDVLRGTDRAAIAAYRRSGWEAVRARQFSAIITDRPGLPLDNPPGFGQDYQECVQPLTARSRVTLPVPVSQRRARPAVVWIPRGSGSCQDAIRTLSGEGRS
jgi:hypothetical protein